MASVERANHLVIDDNGERNEHILASSPPNSANNYVASTPYQTPAPFVQPSVAIVPEYPPVSSVSKSHDSTADSHSTCLSVPATPRLQTQVSSEELTSTRGPPKYNDDNKKSQAIKEESVEKNAACDSLPTQYIDYSRVPAEDLRDPSAFIFAAASAKEPPFPVKLHRILASPEFRDIIAWLPHGRSWRVLKPKAFEERVIPLHFRHCRYSSFMRQVNGWGFQRVYQGADLNSYYHELFLRGMPHLCLKMRRPTGKQAQKSVSEAAKTRAPDFYSISRKNPLPEYTGSNHSTPCEQTKEDPSLPGANEEAGDAENTIEADTTAQVHFTSQAKGRGVMCTSREEAVAVSALKGIQSSFGGSKQQRPTQHAAPVVHQPARSQDLLGLAMAQSSPLDEFTLLQKLQHNRAQQQQLALAAGARNPLPSSASSMNADQLRQALVASQLQNQLLVGALSGTLGGAGGAGASHPSDLQQLSGLGNLGALLQQQRQLTPQLRQLQLLQRQLGSQGSFF